jgi:hypothetical protein
MTCVDCHGDTKKYQPYYAVSDAAQAWQTILVDAKKINLETPEASRIYLRLKNDHHNCFTDAADKDCDQEAAVILSAIKKWKELVKADSGSAIKTDLLYFKNTVLINPEAEYGTILFEAEQDNFPQAMTGRFVSADDGKASGFKYALTPMPFGNPTTAAVRTPVINKGVNKACELTTQAMLTDSINGPYRINEEATHINSGVITPSGLIIKDGHRPYSIEVRSLLIRPDKRMEYAKLLTGWVSNGLASGIGQTPQMSKLALTDGDFDVGKIDVSSTGRTLKDPINVSDFALTGKMVNDPSFKTLPYFMNRSSVFIDSTEEGTTFIDELNNIPLKNLFKLPVDDLTSKDILNFFNKHYKDPKKDFRKDLMFKFVKEKLDTYAKTPSKYMSVQSMDTHLDSLYGSLQLNIMACPGGVCTASTQKVEVTTGSDSGGVKLTYDNALDILKVNQAGTGFETATPVELQTGTAFTRIDLYVYHNIAADSKTYGDNFNQIFYNYSLGVFSEKSRINFPLNIPTSNLDLRAFYSNGANTLKDSDSIENFKKTLYPVLQQLKCISCHGGSDINRVQHSNSNLIIAFNEIQRAKLVNFSTPMNSFRRVVFPTQTSILHNCGSANECADTQADFIAAIRSWGAANEASKALNNALPFHELTEKERTPGMLEYKFKIKKDGLYNIWTKVKTANNFVINLKVLDGLIPVKTTSKIITPVQTANTCIPYVFPDNTDWGWFTPGRANDLTKLDFNGKLKKDNIGKSLMLEDNRTYWRLEAGKTYTLQIFEAAAQTKIDLIAVDYVANINDLLDFQPDLLSRDENNIADYQKRTLSYDISTLVGLPKANAFFRVEVKTALEGQNYIFRNPRIYSPTGKKISVKGIKVYINGATAFNDASWNNIEVTAGDDQILTFAALLALIPSSPTTDYFQFAFEKLENTTKTISQLDPRGTAPVLVEGRKCLELDLFMNTVKPIFRNARLMLKDTDGINDYINSFPGYNREKPKNPNLYQCMTCHNDKHPYFKMTTFDYPEILCAQALSRVDFNNYRESLLIRGINGSGVHPKLHFVEDLQYALDKKSVLSYNETLGSNILAGMIKNQATTTGPAYFSKWISGFYFGIYNQSDLSLPSPAVWANLSPAQQALARIHMGQLRRIDFVKIPADLPTKTYYEPFVHDELLNETQTEGDDLITGVFSGNSKNLYTTYKPKGIDTEATMALKPIDLNVSKGIDNKIKVDASGGKVYAPALDTSVMDTKLEDLKSKYRDVILNWIKLEHEAAVRQEAALQGK